MKPTEELLKRCCSDDRKSHHELYGMCFPFLLSVCKRYYINFDDRVAALNLAYLKIIQNLPAYLKKDPRAPFELWARRITINCVVDEFRKNKKFREQLEFQEEIDKEAYVSEIDRNISNGDMEEILAAIDQLSDMNRTVFNLFVVDGYRHEEIATMLNISPGTSKVHLFRAKMKLRELLLKEWNSPPSYQTSIQ